LPAEVDSFPSGLDAGSARGQPPPVVTIHSPIITPQDSPVIPDPLSPVSPVSPPEDEPISSRSEPPPESFQDTDVLGLLNTGPSTVPAAHFQTDQTSSEPIDQVVDADAEDYESVIAPSPSLVVDDEDFDFSVGAGGNQIPSVPPNAESAFEVESASLGASSGRRMASSDGDLEMDAASSAELVHPLRPSPQPTTPSPEGQPPPPEQNNMDQVGFARRRERRRVNINSRFPMQMPPIKEPSVGEEEEGKLSDRDVSGRGQRSVTVTTPATASASSSVARPTPRSRAGTSPLPASSASSKPSNPSPFYFVPSGAVRTFDGRALSPSPDKLSPPMTGPSSVPSSFLPRHQPSDGIKREGSAPTLSVKQATVSSSPHPESKVDEASKLTIPSKKASRDPHSTFTFQRSPITPRPPANKTSALTASLLKQSSSSEHANPFVTLYGALVSRASDCLKMTIYFPHSEEPMKPVMISAKKDLTVEEVIGVGLLNYWDEGREPKLMADLEDWDGESLQGPLDPVMWNLRIVEDGLVDDDFPGTLCAGSGL
jgi:hypothetical protein